jgi:hypothetical protein
VSVRAALVCMHRAECESESSGWTQRSRSVYRAGAGKRLSSEMRVDVRIDQRTVKAWVEVVELLDPSSLQHARLLVLVEHHLIDGCGFRAG